MLSATFKQIRKPLIIKCYILGILFSYCAIVGNLPSKNPQTLSLWISIPFTIINYIFYPFSVACLEKLRTVIFGDTEIFLNIIFFLIAVIMKYLIAGYMFAFIFGTIYFVILFYEANFKHQRNY